MTSLKKREDDDKVIVDNVDQEADENEKNQESKLSEMMKVDSADPSLQVSWRFDAVKEEKNEAKGDEANAEMSDSKLLYDENKGGWNIQEPEKVGPFD